MFVFGGLAGQRMFWRRPQIRALFWKVLAYTPAISDCSNNILEGRSQEIACGGCTTHSPRPVLHTASSSTCRKHLRTLLPHSHKLSSLLVLSAFYPNRLAQCTLFPLPSSHSLVSTHATVLCLCVTVAQHSWWFVATCAMYRIRLRGAGEARESTW